MHPFSIRCEWLVLDKRTASRIVTAFLLIFLLNLGMAAAGWRFEPLGMPWGITKRVSANPSLLSPTLSWMNNSYIVNQMIQYGERSITLDEFSDLSSAFWTDNMTERDYEERAYWPGGLAGSGPVDRYVDYATGIPVAGEYPTSTPRSMANALWETRSQTGVYIFREELASKFEITSKDELLDRVLGDFKFASALSEYFGWGTHVYDPRTGKSVGYVPFSGYDWSFHSKTTTILSGQGSVNAPPDWQVYNHILYHYGRDYADAYFYQPTMFVGGPDVTARIDPVKYWGGAVDWKTSNPTGSIWPPVESPMFQNWVDSGNKVYTKEPLVFEFQPAAWMPYLDANGKTHIFIEGSGGSFSGMTYGTNAQGQFVQLTPSGYFYKDPNMINPATGVSGIPIGNMKGAGSMYLIIHGDYRDKLTNSQKETIVTLAAIFSGDPGNLAQMQAYHGANWPAFVESLRTDYQQIKSDYNKWANSQGWGNVPLFEWVADPITNFGKDHDFNYDRCKGFTEYVFDRWVNGKENLLTLTPEQKSTWISSYFKDELIPFVSAYAYIDLFGSPYEFGLFYNAAKGAGVSETDLNRFQAAFEQGSKYHELLSLNSDFHWVYVHNNKVVGVWVATVTDIETVTHSAAWVTETWTWYKYRVTVQSTDLSTFGITPTVSGTATGTATGTAVTGLNTGMQAAGVGTTQSAKDKAEQMMKDLGEIGSLPSGGSGFGFDKTDGIVDPTLTDTDTRGTSSSPAKDLETKGDSTDRLTYMAILGNTLLSVELAGVKGTYQDVRNTLVAGGVNPIGVYNCLTETYALDKYAIANPDVVLSRTIGGVTNLDKNAPTLSLVDSFELLGYDVSKWWLVALALCLLMWGVSQRKRRR